MPDKATKRKITFLIDSRLENVSLAGVAVRGICNYLSLSDIDTYYLELCVVEAVNNSIEHAYRMEEGHLVEIEIIHSGRDITFRVSDTGEKMTCYKPHPADFDPADVPVLPEQGMGLYIINSVIDELAYLSDGHKNTLIMRKHLRYEN